MPGEVRAVLSSKGCLEREADFAAIRDQPLPSDAGSEPHLGQRLSSLALPLPQGQPASPAIGNISGKTFRIEPNDAGVQSVSFHFQRQACPFTLTDAKGSHSIKCGL